jgi:hypothetical protein
VSHVTLTPGLFLSPWHVVEYQIPTNPKLSSSISNRFTSPVVPSRQPSYQGDKLIIKNATSSISTSTLQKLI